MKLEEMAAFFEARLDGYDDHMRKNIAGAEAFYPYTAAQLPGNPGAKVLDLGCGTGLELEEYFLLNPEGEITGIDLSSGMLAALREKFPEKKMHLICGSYFTVPFGKYCYDAAVSVESLHHFTREEKLPLYEKLCAALKIGGCFVLTDYFALSKEEEQENFCQLRSLKQEQGIADGMFYHYDTPLTVEHEIEVLRSTGFSSVEVLRNWGATYTLKAVKTRP